MVLGGNVLLVLFTILFTNIKYLLIFTLIESRTWPLKQIKHFQNDAMKGLCHDCFSSGVEVTLNNGVATCGCKKPDKDNL